MFATVVVFVRPEVIIANSSSESALRESPSREVIYYHFPCAGVARLAAEAGETLEKNGAAALNGILGRAGVRELLAAEAAAGNEVARARLHKVMVALEELP